MPQLDIPILGGAIASVVSGFIAATKWLDNRERLAGIAARADCRDIRIQRAQALTVANDELGKALQDGNKEGSRALSLVIAALTKDIPD